MLSHFWILPNHRTAVIPGGRRAEHVGTVCFRWRRRRHEAFNPKQTWWMKRNGGTDVCGRFAVKGGGGFLSATPCINPSFAC